jgi:hypothetical protein
MDKRRRQQGEAEPEQDGEPADLPHRGQDDSSSSVSRLVVCIHC